ADWFRATFLAEARLPAARSARRYATDSQRATSNPGTSWRSKSKGSAFCETRSRQKRTQTSIIVSRPRRRVLLLGRVREKSGFCDLGFLVARANVIVASVINQAITVAIQKR